MTSKTALVLSDSVVGAILEGLVEVNEAVTLAVEVGLGEVAGEDDVTVEVVVVVVSLSKSGHVIWKAFVPTPLSDAERKKSSRLIRGLGGRDHFKT